MTILRQADRVTYSHNYISYATDVAEGETPVEAFARARALVHQQLETGDRRQMARAAASDQPGGSRPAGTPPGPEFFTGHPAQWEELWKMFDNARMRVRPERRDKLARDFEGKTMAACFSIVEEEIEYRRRQRESEGGGRSSQGRGGYQHYRN